MTFLDTGFLFALVSKRDAHHSRVVEVFRTLKDLRLVDHLLTTSRTASSHDLARNGAKPAQRSRAALTILRPRVASTARTAAVPPECHLDAGLVTFGAQNIINSGPTDA